MPQGSFVPDTHDKQKREAFKSRLAGRIEEKETAAQAPIPHPLLNTVVSHPDLGTCTVLSIDASTNSVILSTALGELDLVLSQTLSRLRPIISSLSYTAEPAPIERVQSFSPTNWVRPDQPTAQLERDSDSDLGSQTTTPLTHIPVNTLVWHPDFGAATVFSVDSKNNSITLEFPTHGRLEMVLSQVESKLAPLQAPPPIHANPRFPRLETETRTETEMGAAPEPSEAEKTISLPADFRVWTPVKKYHYLTTGAHFTPERANEFILNNGAGFEVKWENPTPLIETTIERTSEVHSVVEMGNRAPSLSPPGVLSLPLIFSEFSVRDQFSFLITTKRLTREEANNPSQFQIILTDSPEAHQPLQREE